MRFLFVIPRAIWKSFFLLNFLLGLLILYPFFRVLLSRRQWFPAAFRLKRFWAAWILTVPGLFMRTKHLLKPSEHPAPCIYCANHVSYLDIVASYRVIPHYFVFMGKQELDKAPLFRIFFREMNILVNRSNHVAAHKAFLRAAEEIRRGNSVFLFPEGTISSNGQLRGFKNGAFRLAIEQQVPIVPVTFVNNWKLLQNGGFLKATGRPGISRVVVHEPVSTKGMTENDLLTLKNKVADIIRGGLAQ